MARTRGCLWLTAGIVVAILAGVIAFITLSRIGENQSGTGTAPSGTDRQVVVAVQNVPVGTLLTAEMLEERSIPATAAPQDYVPSLDDALGKITLTDLLPSEVLVVSRLADPNVISADGRVALVLSEGQVLMAFPIQDLMSQVGFLKAGDHVDLLYSLDFPTDRGVEGGEDEQATFNLLQNVTVAAVLSEATTTGGTGGAPQALLLTITPQDALTLKYVKDAGGIVDIVLRAPGDEGPFETEPVDVDYLLDRYEIPNAVGR